MKGKRGPWWVHDILLPAVLGTVLGAVLGAIAIVVIALLWPAQAETMWVMVAEGSCLNGRSEPEHGDIEARLLPGWEVDVLERRDGWARIAGYGESGSCWVCDDYLTAHKPGERMSCQPVRMRTTAQKLRVRSCPGGEVLRRLPRGAVVTVDGWMDVGGVRWADVGDGWVMMEYLKEDRR